ncbi:FAD/NAD(P)-binding protein [Corynebacterium sp. 335C]
MTAPATTDHARPRPEPRPDHDEALEAQARRVHEDLAATDPRTDWSDPDDADVAVAIIGGGQASLSPAFALRRAGVGSVVVLDDQPAHRVGCWDDYARMHTLRSPKHMRGIELDCPSLHVQRWFEARYGAEAWDSIDLVPRLDWHDYLLWYREVLDLPVRHETRVEAVSAPRPRAAPSP